MIKSVLRTCLMLWLCVAYAAFAQTVPTPKDHFGFNIGDDYMLANYTQTEAYFKKLASQSDRVSLREMGNTEEGRKQYLLVVSSPVNLKKIAHYKEISQKLARAENLTDEEAKKLSLEGKPIVWIDGGLHATETVGSQQLIELYYQLLSRNDEETRRILDDVVILLTIVNPDGQELVADWYMKDNNVAKRNMMIPRLYQKYIGHDNNRDFYMMNMKESTNISREQYIEWMPQIIYNHHQTSPAGAVVAGPPYRDPFNFVFDPLLVTSIDGVAASMINRLHVESKPGYTRLGGSQFSTWWNGGLRTTPYFHNMVGILTEITGNPTPSSIPLVPSRLIPNNATPFPVTPQDWKFRRSIDYSVSLNYGILDYASRFGDKLLYNIYTMGKNSIKRGNQDTWTLQPKKVALLEDAYKKDNALSKSDNDEDSPLEVKGIPLKYYNTVFKDPALRDPRGYIIPADQKDFPTAVKFLNSLIKSGIRIEQAKSSFTIGNKLYAAGSYIVRTNQAFRPHVLDMFEPQDHPNDFQYPGGPPVRPYDAAGWTLAYQMGVQFDRILDKLDGPFEQIEYGKLQLPPVQQTEKSSSGYLLSAAVNNSFIAVNDLLKAGVEVYRITKAVEDMPEGSFYVPSSGFAVLKKSGTILGTKAKPTSVKPAGAVKVMPGRVALFDQYGGSMPSGWVRWIMEQFHFSYQVVYPQDIDNGNLNSKFDVILFISGGIPRVGNKPVRSNRQPKAEDIPAEFRKLLGTITTEKSVPQLKAFMEKGGNIVTIGSSTDLAYHLGLPVKNALTEVKGEKKGSALPADKFYIPGSILRVNVDAKHPANWGMAALADMDFNNSPVFALKADVEKDAIQPLAWFDKDKALRSGWAWGQDYLREGIVAFVASVGKGKLFAYGPEITFRAQSHSTFKMLFNDLYVLK